MDAFWNILDFTTTAHSATASAEGPTRKHSVCQGPPPSEASGSGQIAAPVPLAVAREPSAPVATPELVASASPTTSVSEVSSSTPPPATPLDSPPLPFLIGLPELALEEDPFDSLRVAYPYYPLLAQLRVVHAPAYRRSPSPPPETCRLEDICPQAIAARWWLSGPVEEDEDEVEEVVVVPTTRPTEEQEEKKPRATKRKARDCEEDSDEGDDDGAADPSYGEAPRKRRVQRGRPPKRARPAPERLPCLFEACTETSGGARERRRHMDTHFKKMEGITWGFQCPNHAVCRNQYGRKDEVTRHLKAAPTCMAVAPLRDDGSVDTDRLHGVDDLWSQPRALRRLRNPPGNDPLAAEIRGLRARHNAPAWTR